MNLKVIKNQQELFTLAAETITGVIKKLLMQKNPLVLAIPGGRSMPPLFADLIKQDIPWVKIHLFIVDERLVSLDNEESNFNLADTFLFQPLKNKLPKENIHPFIYNPQKPDLGAARYEEALKKHGGKFDMIILSAGEDGHVAGLYPHHHSIRDNTPYFITMKDSPKAPPERMTSSRNLLLKSQVAFLFVTGEQKRQAFQNLKNPKIPLEECPAKIVQSLKESYVFTDLS